MASTARGFARGPHLDGFAALAAALGALGLTACSDTVHPPDASGMDVVRMEAAVDAPVDTPPEAMMCPTGRALCGGSCVDAQTDNANCGSCRNVCPAGVGCVMGRCDCAMPRLVCNNTCIDPQTDPMNCGMCGQACTGGQVCVLGMCQAECTAPNTLCTLGGMATCSNLQTDPMNCGSCRAMCADGFQCNMGHCTCPTPARELCGTTCANLQSDPNNCGRCDNSCGPMGSCAMGMCTCGAGGVRCFDACVDIMTSNANCGMCGHACAMDQTCVAGACTCAMGRLACGAVCIDPMTDPANCGACGNSCGPGGACAAGRCTCATGFTMCGTACTNTQVDPMNCGMCGHACPAGNVCLMGACSAAPPTRYMVASPAPTYPFIDACAAAGHTTVLASSDDGTATTTLPFPFRFWATNLPMGQTVTVSSNGWIIMNGSPGFPSLSGSIPPGGYAAMIAPHWSDNYQRTGLCIATVGAAPNRQFVVEWNDSAYCCSTTSGVHLTFEIILNESTNIIDLAYQTMTMARAAGIGLTNTTTAGGNIGGCPGAVGSCVPTDGQRIRFLPIP